MTTVDGATAATSASGAPRKSSSVGMVVVDCITILSRAYAVVLDSHRGERQLGRRKCRRQFDRARQAVWPVGLFAEPARPHIQLKRAVVVQHPLLGPLDGLAHLRAVAGLAQHRAQ